MLATPVQIMKIPPPTRASSPARSTTSLAPAERRHRQQPGPDEPELGHQHRHGGDAGGDVEALGEAEQARGPGRNREPADRVLVGMGEQAGDETDREEDAEGGAEPGGEPLVAQRALVGVLAQREVGVGREPRQPLRYRHGGSLRCGRGGRSSGLRRRCGRGGAGGARPPGRGRRWRRRRPPPSRTTAPGTGPARAAPGRAANRRSALVGGSTSTTTVPSAASSSPQRRSSRSGSPPMPMLPSARSTVRHRPWPGSGSKTDFWRTGAPRLRHSATAAGAGSTPSATVPRWARPMTNRPGPQPTSRTGPAMVVEEPLLGGGGFGVPPGRIEREPGAVVGPEDDGVGRSSRHHFPSRRAASERPGDRPRRCAARGKSRATAPEVVDRVDVPLRRRPVQAKAERHGCGPPGPGRCGVRSSGCRRTSPAGRRRASR